MSRFVLALGVVLLFFSVGCFSGCGGENLIEAGGQVKFNGEPVGPGSLIFYPTGGGRPATSTVKEDGSFVISYRTPGDGLPPGSYKVAVTIEKIGGEVGEEVDGAELNGNVKVISVVPAVYSDIRTTPYTLEIAPDQKEIIIDIKTE